VEDDAAITVTTAVESSMMVMVTAMEVQTARKGLHRIAVDRHVIQVWLLTGGDRVSLL
jgi:hypothetical protein